MDKKKLELAVMAEKIREMHESRISFDERKFAVISRGKIPEKYVRVLKWVLN